MTRAETTTVLSEMTERFINPHNDTRIYWAKEVTFEDFHSKNGHNFIGDYNYYIMPHEVYMRISREIPHDVGVYCPNGSKLRSVKKAWRADRERPVSEMLLMMFRSAARDRRPRHAEFSANNS